MIQLEQTAADLVQIMPVFRSARPQRLKINGLSQSFNQVAVETIPKANFNCSCEKGVSRQDTSHSKETLKTPVGGYTPSTMCTDQGTLAPTFLHLTTLNSGKKSRLCKMDSIESIGISDSSSRDELPNETMINFVMPSEDDQEEVHQKSSLDFSADNPVLLKKSKPINELPLLDDICDKQAVVRLSNYGNYELEAAFYKDKSHRENFCSEISRFESFDSMKGSCMLHKNLKSFQRFVMTSDDEKTLSKLFLQHHLLDRSSSVPKSLDPIKKYNRIQTTYVDQCTQ